MEVVSLIANVQNPSKSDVEVPEPSSELPSSSPGTEEFRQQGDEMDVQQSNEDVDVDIRLLSDDNIPESQQPSDEEHTAELLSSVETDTTQFLTGETASETQGSNLENNTKLQHPIEANKVYIKDSNGEDINESQKGESTTELQALSGEDLLGLQHPENETPPEIQYKREKYPPDMSALQNRDNGERIELQPLMEGNNNKVTCSTEENAELKQTIVEILNPREEDNIEMEYSSEDKTTKLQLPKKEDITEIEQMKEENIADLTHPGEESLIPEIQHPGEEGKREMQSSNEEKICKLEVKDETLGFEHSGVGAISEVGHAMEDSEATILGSDSELEHRMEGNATEMPDSIDIADNKTEPQSIHKDERESQADGGEESQLSETVKMESGSPKAIDIDPQHPLPEDNPLSGQTDHESTTDEQDVRETQEVQLDIAQGQEPEKTELVTSEIVQQSTALTDEPLEDSDAVSFSEATKDSGSLIRTEL